MLYVIKVYKRNNNDDIEKAINELKNFYYKKEEIYCNKIIGFKLFTFSFDNWRFIKKLFNEEQIKYVDEMIYC